MRGGILLILGRSQLFPHPGLKYTLVIAHIGVTKFAAIALLISINRLTNILGNTTVK
jgi:hypothetical protein